MYQIVVDNHDGDKFIIHDSRSNKLKVANAVCELELNKTGSLTFKISPTHPNFSDLKKHMSEIYLLQDNEVIFCGRVLNDETDIYNFKTIVCEGMLGYLLDSVQRAKSYSLTGDSKIKDYLTDILEIHNSQVDDYKKFSVGSITEVDDSETFYKISSYESTLSTLNSDLIDTFNHTYLIPRIKNDKKYIDYLTSNELPINDQVIQFGKNLLSLNRTIKGEEIATAIIPLGATTESTENDNGNNLEIKLTIKDYADGTVEGSIIKKNDYIYDEEAVKKYGWIFKVLNFSGIESDVNELVRQATKQLNYYNKLANTIELNAFDLHLLDANVESFRVGQRVMVYSKNHKLNDFMLVQKMNIDINSPDKTTIVLGDEKRTSIDINNSVSKKMDDTDKTFSDYDKTFDDYDYKLKDYDNKFKNYDDKLKDFEPSKYATKDYLDDKDHFNGKSFNDNIDDYFNNEKGTESYTDLSRYALIKDVQNSFDTLADLIKGV